ncbi:hypothetical protein MW887_006797 [Aspergillus wentii]|nr:hypothetical protein MW887_006797 [Aspergillus wentii]
MAVKVILCRLQSAGKPQPLASQSDHHPRTWSRRGPTYRVWQNDQPYGALQEQPGSRPPNTAISDAFRDNPRCCSFPAFDGALREGWLGQFGAAVQVGSVNPKRTRPERKRREKPG